MRADILIVGQGLAGTLLAWEFERAGISFAIADPGRTDGASHIAAGMINPVTGQRFVKSWRIDSLLPAARATYREMEAGLGQPLWHEMRVRRLFADDRERRIAFEKYARGELSPCVTREPDNTGFWIEQAGRVDLPALLPAAHARWQQRGWLKREIVSLEAELEKFPLVIDCTGAAGARGNGRESKFGFVPWEFSKGEMLALEVDGLEAGVIVNRGNWMLPVGPRAAWVGATHEPKFGNLDPSAAGRAMLEASAQALLGRPFSVTGHHAGVRVNLPDKRPLAGRHPADPRLGIVNGLGAKGALWAPMLARQWVNHLTEGVPFDPAIDVARFAGLSRIT
ncbi:MAG TPA: FAD-dependent oxidoreductase [Opitutaceae bacterium]|nr:FAD-dependent oxidoreductase [Opitutaceae bacterium]